MAFIILLVYCVKVKVKHARQLEQLALYRINREQNKDERIINTMENMRHGLICAINTKYQEPNCVICLEEFDYSPSDGSNLDVHITNECNHTFHTN